jgi:putative glutamine amidotransferase
MTVLMATTDFYSSFQPFYKDLDVYDGKSIPSGTKLVIFSGGEDISPELYSEKNKYSMSINTDRDKIETYLFDDLRDHPEIKILGICRGHQLINVMMGGTLYQDLFLNGMPTHEYSHSLEIYNSPKFPVLQSFYKRFVNGSREVNSLHHQGVKQLAYNLNGVFSYAGIIEAFENSRTVGVQWHPEFIGDEEFFSWINKWSGVK